MVGEGSLWLVGGWRGNSSELSSLNAGFMLGGVEEAFLLRLYDARVRSYTVDVIIKK